MLKKIIWILILASVWRTYSNNYETRSKNLKRKANPSSFNVEISPVIVAELNDTSLAAAKTAKRAAQQSARQRRYYENHRAARLAAKKCYYQEHKAEVLAKGKIYKKRYREAHKQLIKLKCKKRYVANKADISLQRKIYRTTHAESMQAYDRKYRAENREAINKRRRELHVVKKATAKIAVALDLGLSTELDLPTLLSEFDEAYLKNGFNDADLLEIAV